jgi:integrase
VTEQLAEHERLKRDNRLVPQVFHRDGKPICDFRGAWKAACTAAAVPGRILHDFRRTAVRNLERHGVSRSAAMAMVGHKTESIYRRCQRARCMKTVSNESPVTGLSVVCDPTSAPGAPSCATSTDPAVAPEPRVVVRAS